ncbi:MAG: carboxylating nicotinate-nucleotide diphosphorylase [Candidatus Sumerlaeaceae bacterium]|nr:carboxylating nicotinate-nucleotide diphosphorylase [Candidatus Sumerlaeaceae bacterium]
MMTKGVSRSQAAKHKDVLPLSRLVALALAEDVGTGDVTGAIFCERPRKAAAFFLAKEGGRMSGGQVVKEVFRQLDPSCRCVQIVADGRDFFKGQHLIRVEGKLHCLLAGERTALNFLQRLCGIATLTRDYVKALGKYADRIGIYDTRKTTPLLRSLEKKAVRDGGGNNHRFGLFDMVLLKNNHIDAAGGVAEAMRLLLERREFIKRRLRVCIEARTFEEAKEALVSGADIIMLDNMDASQIRTCVRLLRQVSQKTGLSLPEIEVSGGVTIDDIRHLRTLPIQRISVGSLTHSARALDISMRIEI